MAWFFRKWCFVAAFALPVGDLVEDLRAEQAWKTGGRGVPAVHPANRPALAAERARSSHALICLAENFGPADDLPAGRPGAGVRRPAFRDETGDAPDVAKPRGRAPPRSALSHIPHPDVADA